MPDPLITSAIFIPLSSRKPHRNRWAQEEWWRSWSTRAFHSCTFSSHCPIAKFKRSSSYARVKILNGCRDAWGGFLKYICTWEKKKPLRSTPNSTIHQVLFLPRGDEGTPQHFHRRVIWAQHKETAAAPARAAAVTAARTINGFHGASD